jgi:hypothetical protein
MLDNDSRQDSRQGRESHPTYVCINPQLRQFHKVGYEDAKTWMERRLTGMISGVPNWAATTIAGEWVRSLEPDITDLD